MLTSILNYLKIGTIIKKLIYSLFIVVSQYYDMVAYMLVVYARLPLNINMRAKGVISKWPA
jgi:hypothetical protein